MIQNFSGKLRFMAFYVALPLVVAKLLWSLSLFFLDKGSMESLKGESYGYRYQLNIASKVIGNNSLEVIPKNVIQDNDGEEIKNIRLKGTYLGGNASFVILEDAGMSHFVYIGEAYKGYEVMRVTEKKVSLQKHGKNYYILLWEEDSGTTHRPGYQSSAMPTLPPTPGAPSAISRNELNTYIKDPNKIWKNIRIQEQRVNGQINGFRVNYVKKSSFFDVAGLHSGDVIKGIDGNEITSLADVMKYYTNIDSLESLTLTVLRAGEEIELDFNVN